MKTLNSSLFFGSYLVLLFAVTWPSPVASQQLFHELGAFATWASSDHPELPGPSGFGAAANWEFAEMFMARLAYHRLSEDTRKEGTVCDQYSQRINCRGELTETSSTLSGLRTTVMVVPPLGEQIRLGLGGGLSFNSLAAETVGVESGLPADLLAPNAGIIGFTALLSAAVMPVTAVPVKLMGSFGVHWVNFSTCSGEDPPPYEPYCGMEAFKEIEVGVSYAF
jgi:hypothetical protein